LILLSFFCSFFLLSHVCLLWLFFILLSCFAGLPLDKRSSHHQHEPSSSSSSPSSHSVSRLSILLSYLPEDSSSVYASPYIYRIDVPKMEGYFAGAGDVVAALVMAAVLRCKDYCEKNPFVFGCLLEYISKAMSEVLLLTNQRKSRELAIVESNSIFLRFHEKLSQLIDSLQHHSVQASSVVESVIKKTIEESVLHRNPEHYEVRFTCFHPSPFFIAVHVLLSSLIFSYLLLSSPLSPLFSSPLFSSLLFSSLLFSCVCSSLLYSADCCT
jgi:hypothetical protein